MNHKPIRITLISLLLTLALVACGGGNSAPAAVEVTLKLDNTFIYDVVNITAKVGQPVDVTIINGGALEHTFLIDELGVNSGTVAGGQTSVFGFTPDKAGTYTFYCNVPGHKEGGMVGTLTVTP